MRLAAPLWWIAALCAGPVLLRADEPCASDALFGFIRLVPLELRGASDSFGAPAPPLAAACASAVRLYRSVGGAEVEAVARHVAQFDTTVQLEPPRRVTAYAWRTAGHTQSHMARSELGTGSECDPIRWRVEGSADNVTWAALDDRS